MAAPRKVAPAPKRPLKSVPKAAEPQAVQEATSLKARVEKLEKELGETRWCFAEMIHGLRMAQANAMLENPEVKKRMAAEIVAKMQNAGDAQAANLPF